MTSDAKRAVEAGRQPPPQDDLLECLRVVARAHDQEMGRDALVAGLPLEEGRLTPGVFPRAAARAGLAARHARSRLVQLNPALMPVVVMLEPGRACVLVSLDVKARTARVIFPELGEAATEITLDELQARYSGRVIYARPKFRFDARGPEVNKQKARHWFWGVIRENRRLYRDVIIGSVMINLFAVAMPLFVMNVYDRVVPNQATETLWVLSAGIFVVLCFDLALRLMRNAFVDLAASRADVKLSSSIMQRVLGMRLEGRPASTGSFAATLQSFESVRAFIGSATVVGLVDLPFVLMFVAIIAIIGVPLAIPIAVGIVFVLLYALAAQGKLHELSETTWRVGAQRNATLVESLGNLETVKTLRAESRLQAVWEKTTAFLSRTSAQLRLISSSVSSVALWAQHTVAVAVIIVGVYLIIEGDLSQGGLIAAYLLSSRAMAPVSQAAALLAQYHQSSTALESLNGVMDKPVERPEGKSFVSRPVVRGEIELSRITLRYPDEERDAIRDISLKIKPGEKVALLGRVGSGKSTLNKLMLGLYEPTSGAVLLDGVDIRQFDPIELRRHIGYVPQDVSLFYGSLRENVVAGGGSEGVEDEALLQALTISGIDELVDQHPHGVDLPVGERGQMLSGGQRQGVAIARAVVHDPQILLFDEPTSAMDHASEEAFKKRLSEYAAAKTMVVVTHRTSLLSLVDRIVVVDNGKIVADGPKDKVVEALRSGQIGRAN
ncbi:ATP-binding cassette, subfamily C, LapB [Franzmannia pantelleriensis]|uniref:ATP-binding cassette, subfamily C, LapB n=2 Tax=Franzmannia pantelleriensis TaxID=48727 RepID=A0A1G9X8X4_9GAMM|nr:type I secretion system permease/ATPase [Halomonas pantelleriensis]SDM93194.1 ATP-binding cassette, subfamily C, LapB [Halomonas pantelleriensis]